MAGLDTFIAGGAAGVEATAGAARSATTANTAFTSSLRGVSASATQATNSLTKLTRQYVLIFSSLNNAISVLSRYNRTLNESKIFLGGTAREVAMLSDRFKDLSKSTTFLRTELASMNLQWEKSLLVLPKSIGNIQNLQKALYKYGGSATEAKRLYSTLVSAWERAPGVVGPMVGGAKLPSVGELSLVLRDRARAIEIVNILKGIRKGTDNSSNSLLAWERGTEREATWRESWGMRVGAKISTKVAENPLVRQAVGGAIEAVVGYKLYQFVVKKMVPGAGAARAAGAVIPKVVPQLSKAAANAALFGGGGAVAAKAASPGVLKTALSGTLGFLLNPITLTIIAGIVATIGTKLYVDRSKELYKKVSEAAGKPNTKEEQDAYNLSMGGTMAQKRIKVALLTLTATQNEAQILSQLTSGLKSAYELSKLRGGVTKEGLVNLKLEIIEQNKSLEIVRKNADEAEATAAVNEKDRDLQAKARATRAIVTNMESQQLQTRLSILAAPLEQQASIASSAQSILSAQLQMAEIVQLPPATRLKIVSQQLKVAAVELTNAKESLKAYLDSGAADPTKIATHAAAIKNKEVEVISKMGYARRTWLEKFTAGSLGIGGTRPTAIPTDIPESAWQGPAWYKGAVAGEKGGRAFGQPFEERMWEALDPEATQRTYVEKAIGKTLDAIKGMKVEITVDPKSLAAIQGHISNIFKNELGT